MPYPTKFGKKAKIKIKFQKMKSALLDSIPWLKSHQPSLLGIYAYNEYLYSLYLYMFICIKYKDNLSDFSSRNHNVA